MQVEKIQNNNYNPQFYGTLALYDNTRIWNRKVKEKMIPKSADKLLLALYEKQLPCPNESDSVGFGLARVNKRDLLEYIGYVNIFLNLSPQKIIFDKFKELFGHSYSCKENGDKSYQIGLNDRYTIEHIISFKDNDNY